MKHIENDGKTVVVCSPGNDKKAKVLQTNFSYVTYLSSLFFVCSYVRLCAQSMSFARVTYLLSDEAAATAQAHKLTSCELNGKNPY